MNDKTTITIWKDGSYKLWGSADAHYAANDPDWLVNIPLEEVPASLLVSELARREGVTQYVLLPEEWAKLRFDSEEKVTYEDEDFAFIDGPARILIVRDG